MEYDTTKLCLFWVFKTELKKKSWCISMSIMQSVSIMFHCICNVARGINTNKLIQDIRWANYPLLKLSSLPTSVKWYLGGLILINLFWLSHVNMLNINKLLMKGPLSLFNQFLHYLKWLASFPIKIGSVLWKSRKLCVQNNSRIWVFQNSNQQRFFLKFQINYLKVFNCTFTLLSPWRISCLVSSITAHP